MLRIGVAETSSPSTRMPASMLLRELITATAASDMVIGELPEGPAKHFCKPAVAMSMPQASTSKRLPPREAVSSE